MLIGKVFVFDPLVAAGLNEVLMLLYQPQNFIWGRGMSVKIGNANQSLTDR